MKKSPNQPSESVGKNQPKSSAPTTKASTKRAAAQVKDEQPSEPIKRAVSPRLHVLYTTDVVPKLKKDFGYSNAMEVPRVVKVTINMDLGAAVGNPKIIESAVSELRAISGQAPVVTRAKKSIATFKLREGQKIGAMVTLRREKMWEFLDRLVSFALPRVRDFKGISVRSFDGRGNFSTGIREQIIFPEISYERIDQIKGMNISIVTTAQTDEEGRALLRYLGMPFRS